MCEEMSARGCLVNGGSKLNLTQNGKVFWPCVNIEVALRARVKFVAREKILMLQDRFLVINMGR